MDNAFGCLIGAVASYLDRPRPLLLRGAFIGVMIVFMMVWPWDPSTLPSPFSPDAGRRAVPEEVHAMRALAVIHGVTRFRIGADLTKDPELWLRVIEYLYPARLAPDAGFVFTRGDDPEVAFCLPVGAVGTIRLVMCGS